MVSRALRSAHVLDYYGIDDASVLADADAQRAFFNLMVPEKIDVGNNPLTFEWILGRVRDGTGQAAPREVIHLLNEARDAQVQMVEQGVEEPPDKELLGRAAFRAGLKPVSIARLEQAIYAEFPNEAIYIKKLEQSKTAHSVDSLSRLWGISSTQAADAAQQLVDIGFFDRARALSGRGYWVPHLYRPGLNLIQGSADVVSDDDDFTDFEKPGLDGME